MRYLKFIIPFVAVALVDILFQCGVWEPVASPNSHAGMTITKKRALDDPAFSHIDFVTLGSSRPVYGIDHEALSGIATEKGFVHANLSVAGMHWMSVEVFTHWLRDHHPEIRGGIIAFAIQDFLATGNGTYELGIAYPFRRFSDIAPMEQHVPFDWHDASTYGLYSGLFAYHEDVQDLMAAPRSRLDVIRYFRALTPAQVLAGNVSETKNICSAQIQTLADCATLPARTHDAALDNQCAIITSAARERPNPPPFKGGQPLTDQMRLTRDMVQRQLRAIEWKQPPIVVLMPMEEVWMREVMPAGTHAWVLSILQPLVSEGKIQLVDYTDIFNGIDGQSDCSAFFDLYHNNVSGRERLMQQLIPYAREHLYTTQASAQ